MTQKKLEELAKIDQQLKLVRRQTKAALARENLMDFIKFTMPDPEDTSDADKSLYHNALHHDAIARVVEEVEKGEIQFLILTVPPRHGKSEIVSRRLPAWYLGRNPRDNVVLATYNDDFAKDFGADVRAIMKSPQYRTIFPNVTLQTGGAAKERLQTKQGGMATFVGVGGSLTGRGAHCLPGGTLVWTTAGQIPIKNLKDAPSSVKVVSYDRHSGALRTNGIEALSARQATRIYRITDSRGRVVESTGDHPFLTARGYIRADQLTPGDRLLCAVPQGDDQARLRGDEAPGSGPDGVLLLEQMLGVAPEQEGARSSGPGMLRVRERSSERCEIWVPQDSVLLETVLGEGSREAQGCDPRPTALAQVPGMRDGVPEFRGYGELPREEEPSAGYVLQQDVREPRALAEDVRHDEPGLATRPESGPGAAACREGVSGSAAGNTAAGFGAVCGLRFTFAPSRTPHQPDADGQPLAEPDRDVPFVPPGAPRERAVVLAAEESVVRRVDEVPVGDGGVEVFDIQVERDHNFFANGFCVSNCLIIDDVIKDYEQARSQAFRDRAWEWFTKVAMTRRMGRKLVIITFTRWHTDDIIGRLTDPENEYFNASIAEKIRIINFPAIAEEGDPLGRAPGEPLWPERYDLDFLQEQRSLDPLGFEALYQQRPTLADGVLFRRENIRYYDPGSVDVSQMRVYCVSDHAVSTTQRSDSTVLLRVGLDRQNNIYLLDCWWKKAKTDEVVEAMLTMARQEPRPLIWWAEKGHISKSIGPFLRKRMSESSTFFNLVEVTPAADKEQRAQAISARMAMGYVHFPKDKPWVERAVNELLAFPNGLHDDFCLAADTEVTLADGARRRIDAIREGDFVATPEGPCRVAAAVQTSSHAEVRRVRLSDGRVLIATGNHPLFVAGKGFVPVDALAYGDVLFDERQDGQWQSQKCSSTAATGIADTRKAGIGITGSTSTLRSPAAGSCTATSGRILTGRYPPASRSTTQTKTRSTTTPGTWSFWPFRRIVRSTSPQEAGRWTTSLTSTAYVTSPASGTGARKAALGTPSTESAAGRIAKWWKSAVSAVARRSRPFSRESVFATTRAVRVTAVEALTTPQPVYNLAVENSHVFYANGVLTHNCDALAYVGLGLQSQIPVKRQTTADTAPKYGTFRWVKEQQREADRAFSLSQNGGF